ncbi:hypothetical protein H112_02518 [Trichophyton rubrum D6]|uniref:Uncharacterized protein n=2 Tax=Trichophyton rubrum TaxID=5551 RepID=A0A080WI03_TRIRC|nr:uncharacterized protein TERG_12390 [Trichophyton rubrum CBS 118892]EZF25175.1 hypothetical protein H100_02519 [Trichophyton rubrum MR850]EZF44206.1 hypothetical protein H102_02513 [Trichophyton rubrum CBS 100081]EZF54858.1 hypothetical protein H103_02526 [Trichophyton rubrum CBS 288.86]EZF65467.1 hypothetical protein H104_02504 [Trichophyton rubrum CBS 289.86]EZF86766.1 hypothetical protein H110_02523 [Trichophyton rubrum MR1448]EZF97550.1 hypothetical protein H113_02531 [Trichophyton rubr
MDSRVCKQSVRFLAGRAGWVDEVRVIDQQRNEDVQRIMMGHPSVHRWRAAYGWTVTNMHHTYIQTTVLVVSPGIGWTRPVSVDEPLLQRCAAWQATPCMKSEGGMNVKYSQEKDHRHQPGPCLSCWIRISLSISALCMMPPP